MPKIKVKFWIIEKQIRATQIADDLEISDAMVSQFLKGEKTSQNLADYLIKKGCPKKYFKNGRVAA